MRNLLFSLIHHLVSRYPLFVVGLSLFFAITAGYYGSVNMEIITDQDRLLSEELDYHRRYMEFVRQFGDLEFLYIIIEGGTEEQRVAFAETLEERLKPSQDVKEIVYYFETSWAKDYAFYYATQNELNRLEQQLTPHREEIEELFSLRNVDDILRQISTALEDFGKEAGPSSQMNQRLDQFIQALRGENESSLQELSTMEEEIEANFSHEREYIIEGEYLLMLVMPAKDFSTLSVIQDPLNRIRADIWLTEQDFPGIQAGLTGRPALQAEEMTTTNKDMQNASIMAIIGVSFLFIIFFREVGRPLCGILALLMAMGWTYGFVAMTLGHLNLLSMVFALVMIGLGIDFGIHFIHRYQEELKIHHDTSPAVWNALRRVGPGILTGAVTSSVAFLLALLTDFLGLAELGYVAGAGILFCLIAMLLTLSGFLTSYDRYLHREGSIPNLVHFVGLRHVSRHPLILIIVIAVLTIALIPKALDVRFNDNLLELQAPDLESVKYEHKLIEESDYSTWYAVFIEPTLEDMLDRTETLKDHTLVAHVDSLANVLPKVTEQKQETLNSIASQLNFVAGATFAEYNPNPYIRRNLLQKIEELNQQMERMQQAAQQTSAMDLSQIDPSQLTPEMREPLQQAQNNSSTQSPPEMTPEQQEMVDKLNELAALLSQSDRIVNQRLKDTQQRMLTQPRESLCSIYRWASMDAPTHEDLPPTLHSIYVGDNGRYLVMAYPKENIWDTEPMHEFVSAMREIDPEVTGTPIQVYESSLLMREAFTRIGTFSFIVVGVLVFLDFMSLSSLFFVMTPLALGVLWLVECMGIFNVNLNLANFFAIPILIGIGVDNAVHFFHRYLETNDIEHAMSTTGTTLSLTTMTTMTGFGSLIFASHQGLASLGVLMVLGSATCWFACLVFLPALIKVCGRHRPGDTKKNTNKEG